MMLQQSTTKYTLPYQQLEHFSFGSHSFLDVLPSMQKRLPLFVFFSLMKEILEHPAVYLFKHLMSTCKGLRVE